MACLLITDHKKTKSRSQHYRLIQANHDTTTNSSLVVQSSVATTNHVQSGSRQRLYCLLEPIQELVPLLLLQRTPGTRSDSSSRARFDSMKCARWWPLFPHPLAPTGAQGSFFGDSGLKEVGLGLSLHSPCGYVIRV